MAGLLEFKSPREAYGDALVELGGERPEIVVLDADMSTSTQTQKFGKAFPNRFFNVGIAEQCLFDLAAGLALSGKTVFASTFAVFSTRAWEQIRNTVAYNKCDVKIVVSHGGITVGPDGASHQMCEDLALMRTIPNMTVTVSADAASTKKLVRLLAGFKGPAFLRLSRESLPTVYGDEEEVRLGEAKLLREGSDVSILACGLMVNEALKAWKALKQAGVSAQVWDVHTLKPLDRQAVLKAADTGAVVTAEEHSVIGGLGEAVAGLLCEEKPVLLKRVGLNDVFGRSGPAWDLMRYYGLTGEKIVEAAYALLARKRGRSF